MMLDWVKRHRGLSALIAAAVALMFVSAGTVTVSESSAWQGGSQEVSAVLLENGRTWTGGTSDSRTTHCCKADVQYKTLDGDTYIKQDYRVPDDALRGATVPILYAIDDPEQAASQDQKGFRTMGYVLMGVAIIPALLALGLLVSKFVRPSVEEPQGERAKPPSDGHGRRRR